jgi:hypothetical protein
MTLVSNDNVIRFSIRCQAISRQHKIETTTVIFCQLAAELLRHWKKMFRQAWNSVRLQMLPNNTVNTLLPCHSEDVTHQVRQRTLQWRPQPRSRIKCKFSNLQSN